MPFGRDMSTGRDMSLRDTKHSTSEHGEEYSREADSPHKNFVFSGTPIQKNAQAQKKQTDKAICFFYSSQVILQNGGGDKALQAFRE